MNRTLLAMLSAATLLVLGATSGKAQDDGRVPAFRRGDANGDGRYDISDPVATLVWLFRGATDPTCFDAADTNDDGTIDLSDSVWSLNYLFLGATPPPSPFPLCGVDPTPDELECEVYLACVLTDFFELVADLFSATTDDTDAYDVNAVGLDFGGPTTPIEMLVEP